MYLVSAAGTSQLILRVSWAAPFENVGVENVMLRGNMKMADVMVLFLPKSS